MNLGQDETLHALGLTLAEFAAWRGTHPQALRPVYRDFMRKGDGAALPPISRRTDDQFDGTIKFCLPTSSDGASTPPLETESVIIPMSSYRGTQWATLCISSQVGCRMGCTFCETGRMGLLRNLTAGEIVRQRLAAHLLRSETSPQDSRPRTQASYFSDGIQNIVFMGMGEPLDNFDAVVQAIRVFSEPAGMKFPHAQITLSTVGRIDGLRKLAALRWINLRIAISLNAANDRLRDELMPINRGMPLAELKHALLEYPLAPRGRFLIEYVLIKGVNDSPVDAAAVAAFCRDLPCIVNIIPYNPQRFASFETPSDETILAFMKSLKDEGIFVKRRVTHGRALMGACGQLGNPHLRRHNLAKEPAA